MLSFFKAHPSVVDEHCSDCFACRQWHMGLLPPPALHSPPEGGVNVAHIKQGAVAIVHTRASWPTGSSSLLFSRWTGCFAHCTIGKHAQRELPDILITTFVFISL